MDLHPSSSTSSSVKLEKSREPLSSELQSSHLKMGIITLHLYYCNEDRVEGMEEVPS